MKYLSKPSMSGDKPNTEYQCAHCGATHDNEFSLTCAECDYKRESEGLEIEG